MFVTTTFNEVRDTVLQLCIDITGREVVLANAGEGPKPSVPYVEVYVTLAKSPNFQTNTLSEDGLTETIRAVSVLEARLDFYGGDAMQDASKLLRSLKSAQRERDLLLVCGHANTQDLRDLTFLETGSRKQRAQVVISLSCNLADSFDADFANRVSIDLYNQDGLVEEDLPGGANPRAKAAICPI